MDLNDLRILWTVLSFAAFLGIVWWAYSGKRKARFDEAARLALDDEPGQPPAAANKHHREGSTT
jgi:cytochrome c oxidase cbb3-type subunit 4